MDLISWLLHTVALAIIGLLLALGSFFTGHAGVVDSLPTTTTSTSTAPASFPVATTTANISTVSTKTKTVAVVQKPATSSTDVHPTTPQATPVPAQPLPTEELNSLTRASLVNILCTTKIGGSFNPISGSGVIIDSRGIILTNAHVAQYFLLHDYPTAGNINCVIRVGSPAEPRYTAKLLYLPPAWISSNASQIKNNSPTGTGENDYAFLLIDGTTNPSGTLPDTFAALPMDGGNPQKGDQVLIAAYPAGFLGGIAISLNLYIASAIATVGEVYTFKNPANIDLFSLGGTIVSQSGSSGGAAVTLQGKLRGIISTEIPADTTSLRDLRAITVAHINRSLTAAGLGGIDTFLSQNVGAFAANFNAKLGPAETKALEDALEGN